MDEELTRRRLLELTGSVTALGLAGCSGPAAQASAGDESDSHSEEGSHSHGGSIGEPTAAAEVAVNTTDDGEQHFSPHVVWVEPGGTVTWVLESGSHTATAYHPENDQPSLVPEGAKSWDSGYLSEEGDTFEHTFETEGVYHYYCIPHEVQGMIGSVIVGEPDPHEQVALEEPPADKPEKVRHKITELNEMIRPALGDDHDDSESDGHHEETEEGHHDDTESGDHHDETATEHHEDGEDAHHEETATEHHDSTEDGHHDGTATEHHDSTETAHDE